MKAKILLFDIETTPNIAYTWEKWETNVIAFKEYWKLLCFGYKWLGGKTKVKALKDYKEKDLVMELWKLFDEADVLVAHNGNNFDIKKANALFLKYNIKPPSPYKKLDTLQVARRYFKFDSNKLNDLGEYLDLGKKINTGGFDLWLGCMNNDKKAWKKMIQYNKQDVELLEKVYLRMRPFIETHPNIALMEGELLACPNCGSTNINRRGYRYSRVNKFARWRCMDCCSWHSSPFSEQPQIR